MKLLQWDELFELGEHRHNIVYIQIPVNPKKMVWSGYYRVSPSFSGLNCEKREYIQLQRFGSGRTFGYDSGFKKKTYLKEWRAYFVAKDVPEIDELED